MIDYQIPGPLGVILSRTQFFEMPLVLPTSSSSVHGGLLPEVAVKMTKFVNNPTGQPDNMCLVPPGGLGTPDAGGPPLAPANSKLSIKDMNSHLNARLRLSDIDRYYLDLRTGMHSPQIVTLSPQTLYKFSSSKIPPSERLYSPWWFTESDYSKMGGYLALDSSNPGFVARLQAAVKYAWSDLDILVVAKLAQWVNVFQGPGMWQIEKTSAGSNLVFQAPQDVVQTYIPGLSKRSPSMLNPELVAALCITEYRPLGGMDEIDKAILAVRNKTVILSGNPMVH